MRKEVSTIWLLCLGLAVLFLLWPGSLGLYGPDEPRYASIARHMAASGAWVTPTLDGAPWLEKPPLLYWLGAVGFSLGLGPEAAPRLPVALLAVLFLLWWWRRLQLELSPDQSFRAVVLLATSAGWVAYGNIAVTDVPMTVCFSAAMLVGWRWSQQGRWQQALACGLLFGLAALAKGLVPLALSLPLAWFARKQWRQWPIVVAACLLVAGPWYTAITLREGWNFYDEFFLRHHFQRVVSDSLQHVQPFWFYLPVLLGLLFPWCFWAGALRKLPLRQPGLAQFALAWALWTLLFFSIATNKLPGYVLPAVPAFTLLLGMTIQGVAWRYVSVLLVLLVGVSKLFVLPNFDHELTARALAAKVSPHASDACADAVPRSLRYGLHYYIGRPLGECFEMPGAFAVMPTAPAQPHKLLFRVQRPASTDLAPWKGRLLIMATREPNGEAVLTVEEKNIYRVWAASREVIAWRPLETITVDPVPMTYPGHFDELPEGQWTFQAIFDPDHSYAAHGLDAEDWVSPQVVRPVQLQKSAGQPIVVSLALANQRMAPPRPQWNVRVRSELLSRFHHQEIFLQAQVEGAPSAERLLILHGWAEDPGKNPWRQKLAGETRQKIYLSCDGPFGHHAFVNSDVNGPWGDALQQELLPELERRNGRPSKYLVTGNGLGAFGGQWLLQQASIGAHAPLQAGELVDLDPPPLFDFYGIDLTTKPKQLFRKPNGEESKTPWGRTVQNDAHREAVLGPHGGRWECYEAILGPRTAEGISRQLFARGDGSIDPEVLEQWLRREFRKRK